MKIKNSTLIEIYKKLNKDIKEIKEIKGMGQKLTTEHDVHDIRDKLMSIHRTLSPLSNVNAENAMHNIEVILKTLNGECSVKVLYIIQNEIITTILKQIAHIYSFSMTNGAYIAKIKEKVRIDLLSVSNMITEVVVVFRIYNVEQVAPPWRD